MSIATEISRLTTLRNNIRTKLINLGIISNSSATLSDCYTGLNGVTKQTASGNTTLNSSTTTKSFAAGYYPNAHGATHAVVNIPDPTITVSGNGLITASGSWTAGFTSDTSYSGTSQLVPCPARVWVPTTTDQSISPPGFLTGVQTIKGDANLVGANIKSGVSIFGVDGAYVPYLEFTNKSVALNNWVSDQTYSEYPYRAAVTCSGATADMSPYVEFSNNDKSTGYFNPEAQSYAGGVYIYATEPVAITISKITFYKRS